MGKKTFRAGLAILLAVGLSGQAWGWSGHTHIFIAKQAGVKYPEAACFPDVSWEDNEALLKPYHYHNAPPDAVVTPEYIDNFAITSRSVKLPDGARVTIRVPDESGVLYRRIVELYKRYTSKKYKPAWQYDYYEATLAHFVADLSQPLHNYPYLDKPAGDGLSYGQQGDWALKKHGSFDRRLDDYLKKDPDQEKIPPGLIVVPTIKSEDDLKREIAKIANRSIALANKCFAEQSRIMTREEAINQAALSISLLKGILKNRGN